MLAVFLPIFVAHTKNIFGSVSELLKQEIC